jgi:hypothetical protein
MVRRHHRWKRGLFAKLAMSIVWGVILATATQAFARPDMAGRRTGVRTGAASQTTPKALRALGRRRQAEARFYQSRSRRALYARPDDRAGIHAVDGKTLFGANGKIRGIAPAVATGVVRTSSRAQSSVGRGIDVRDVSIGVAIGLGAVLAASSLLSIVRGSRRTGPNPSV